MLPVQCPQYFITSLLLLPVLCGQVVKALGFNKTKGDKDKTNIRFFLLTPSLSDWQVVGLRSVIVVK